MPGLQVASSQVVRDIVSEISGERLSAAQGINGLRAVMIEDVSVAQDEPSQSSGIFFRVRAGIGLDSAVSGGGPVQNQLLRHGTQSRRRDKRLVDTPHAGGHRA